MQIVGYYPHRYLTCDCELCVNITKRFNPVICRCPGVHFSRFLRSFCRSYSTLVTRTFSMSDRTDMSVAVMQKEIRTKNNSNDVSTNSIHFFDNRYYIVNKRMLCILGQWPYQSDLEKRLRLFLLLFISFSILIPQLRYLVCTWGRFDTFVECFTPLAAHLGIDIKLLNLKLHQRQLRSLLDKTRQDWESMRNLPQEDIIKKYGEKGRFWSILWLSMVYVVMSFWVVLAMTPKVLDVLKPLNHSRATFDVIPVDYGIDPVKYWWPIQMHIWIWVASLFLVFPAFDSLYMILAQHACGMFEILRYQLDNMLEEVKNVDVLLKPDYHADVHYRKIVSCIKEHRYLIESIKEIESTYAICMIIILGLNMVGLSVTGYQAVAKGTPLADVIRYSTFGISILVHLFIVSLPGHWVMSSSTLFPDSAYSCGWYMMSLRSQKLIMLLIRASIEPCTIVAGRIYVMSVQNFCSVLQTSISYLTMLTSMQ